MGDEEVIRLRNTYGLEPLANLEQRQDQVKIALVRKALQKAYTDNPTGPVVFAARLLGLERSRLSRFMKKHRLDRRGMYVS